MRIAQVVEVIADRGDDRADRWSRGSGYLVTDGVVLTAAHVIDSAVQLFIRVGGTTEFAAAELLRTPPDVDIALVSVTDWPGDADPAVFGSVSRARPGRIGSGRAIGFPRFKEVSRGGRRIRDSVQVDGYIPTAEGLISGYLTFHVEPQPAPVGGPTPESAWAGMSGASVFADDVLIGVVKEHHLAEGDASLTVSPVDRLGLAGDVVGARFWELVRFDPSRLATLEPEAEAKKKPRSGSAILALPATLSDFTGRTAAVKTVTDLLSGREGRSRVVVIWGAAGVGKSQLAVEVAHRLLPGRDGAVHIDLQGYSANRLTPDRVAARLLEVLAPDTELPADVATQFAVCREAMRQGNYVVVLDNASNVTQVRDLLPGPSDTVVLVTSRASLATLDAELFELDVLDVGSAIGLIRGMVEADGGPTRGSDADVAELVRLCGQLPLALRIAGALLRARPRWSIEYLNRKLTDEARRLDLLERDDLAVRTVFASSFVVLDETTQQLFALLGCVGATRIAPWMAAALLDTDLLDAEELLERLIDTQLLRVADTDASGTLRYRFHDLVRLYAREKLRACIDPATARNAAHRLLSGHLAVALHYTYRHPITANYNFAKSVAVGWLVPVEDLPTPKDPMEWLYQERTDLIAAVEQAQAERFWALTWGLADILNPVFILSSHGPESRHVKDLAMAAARAAGDTDAELEVRFSYVSLLLAENRHGDAVAELQELRRLRLDHGEARKAAHLALMTGVIERDGGMLAAADRSLARSLSELGLIADPDDPAIIAMIASARHNLAIVRREQCRLREADELLAEALPVFHRLDDAIAYGRAMHTRGVLRMCTGSFDEAQECFQRSFELCRGVGDRRWTTIALLGQARLAGRRRKWDSAAKLLDECEERFTSLSEPAGIAQVQRSRAVLFRRTGRLADADKMFSTALETLATADDRRSLARVHYSRALLELARADATAATTETDCARELFTAEDDDIWLVRLQVLDARISGSIPTELPARLRVAAQRAGDGYLPLWIADARTRLGVC